MVKKMTPFNKALVQDWNKLAAMDDDEPVLRVISQRKIAALVAMCEYLKWRTRYDNPPDQDVLDDFSAQTEFDLTNPIDLCELMEPCLSIINDKLDSIQGDTTNITNIVNELKEAMEAGKAREKELPPVPTNAIYAGALSVVRYMNRKNLQIYQEAEDSAVDNAAEMTDSILQYVPNATAIQVAAGADLANQYFNNQVSNYIEQYPDFEQPAACNLYCFIIANDEIMNVDVWGDWLNGLDALLPDSAPAALYAKYSPLRQTFLNQIAALINGEQSLQSYFDEILQAYYTGTTEPVALPPECDCSPEWDKEWDFRIDPYTWTVDATNGEWIEGEGFRNVLASPNSYAVYIRQLIDMPPLSAITGWYIEAYSENADPAADRAIYWYPGAEREDINTGQTGDWDMSGTPLISAPEEVMFGVTNFVIPGTNIIRKIRLTGTGAEPTWD